VIPINVLNDDVLLAIFDFCVADDEYQDTKRVVEAWQSLVHVCRRWRSLVFGSPRRLNLQLFCTPKTPTSDTLDVWPALPLIVYGDFAESGTDNIIAALGHSNRVSQVILTTFLGWQLEEVLAAMHVPFPELTELRLFTYDPTPPVIPDSFLGGSAPRLQYVDLKAIPFPGLPNLLLSASHLVYLGLWDIPRSGYISSEGMVALISGLSSLEALSLGFEFESPQSRPDLESRSPPPHKRSILPALVEFRFKGVSEYLEDLVTFIDAPQLNYFYTNLFTQIDFDAPRLAQFINRTPTLRALDEAHVQFDYNSASVVFRAGSRTLNLLIICGGPDGQLRSNEQVCNSLHLLSTVEDLYIKHQYSRFAWNNDGFENTLWFELLLSFTAVKNLYLSKEFAPYVATALQELVGGRITEVLPSLQNIFVEGLEPSGPFQKNIGQFVAARRLSSHPIAISVWDNDTKMKPM
jgi:hypothetical protein